MKPTLVFAFLLLLVLPAQGQKVIEVTTHNRLTITTDPTKGENPYPAWGLFPQKDVQVRRIMMHVTLGCPDSMPCAHWDYVDHIRIRRAGGQQGASLDFEIGRMLTPYGSIFRQGWEWTWSVDVTDFSLVLRDSVEIEYNHSGYETTSVGWALTLRFEILTGQPVAEAISITPLWVGHYPYGDPEKPLVDSLSPRSYNVNQGSAFQRLRIQHTGHGMDQPRGCSEFCSRWRKILWNGKEVEHLELWKDCGDNPLYPQGGTWIYDRAHWCPGDLQVPDQIDLWSNGGSHTLTMEMEPYTATANIQANENISSHLIQYRMPAERNDVAVEEILVPNRDPNYSRMNPAAFNPIVRIRNLGRDILRSVVIHYGTEGFDQKVLHWYGQLGFNEAAEVHLGGMIQHQPGENRFTVSLSQPNGRKDGWPHDNRLTRTFDSPITLPEGIIIQFLTNNQPEENRLFIVGPAGDTLYNLQPVTRTSPPGPLSQRRGETGNLLPATLYTDTLHLPAGLYELSLTDSGGQGLEFWYEPQNGYGFLRLLDLQGRLIRQFEPDCGNGQFLAFSTLPDEDYLLTSGSARDQYAFLLFPRRVRDAMTIEVHADSAVPMEIILTVDGLEVERHAYGNVRQGRYVLNLAHLEAGRYIMEILMNGESQLVRRFNKE